MSKFTRDDGAEFVQTAPPAKGWLEDGEIVIRPVPEAKWEVKLLPEDDLVKDYRIEVKLPEHMPVDQAQLIKEAVEALMTFINIPKEPSSIAQKTLWDFVYSARSALKGAK